MNMSEAKKESKYTVYYHTACKGFTGRAFSPLCLLETGASKGVTYETKAVDELPAGTNTFAPPMVTFPDGTTIGQTGAICIELGKDMGLLPETPSQQNKAMQITMDVADFLADASGKKGPERCMKWMNHFETVLGDKPYMMGDAVTYVDYTAMGCFNIIKLFGTAECLKGVEMTPKVKAWFEKMSEDAAVKKILALAPFLPEGFL